MGSMLWLLICLSSQLTEADSPPVPIAIPTFHCIGLYWSPPGGSAEKVVEIRYRLKGKKQWEPGLPMRYNPIEGTDLDLADYRGSLVNLKPGNEYEIELTLSGTNTKAVLTAQTWSEHFPIARIIRVPGGNQPLEIRESGSPEGYLVFDGQGATIDVGHRSNYCVRIDASYVIVRNFQLKGAGTADPPLRGVCGAILIEGGQNIVIEDCDISDWGRLDPQTGFGRDCDSGIYSRASSVARLVVQRCRIHHPTWTTNPWDDRFQRHTTGPQCISLFNTAGNHVIRYNEFFSDLEHMYNDTLGGGSNGSYRGAPGPDSDVYGNIVSHCWDDAIEVEGGNRNVRVWGNYITQAFMGIGNAATSIGPLYVWRNIFGRCQRNLDIPGAHFVKMGYADSEDWMTGHMYFFHNTVFDEGGWLPQGGLGGGRILKHVISRNNVLHIRSERGQSIGIHPHSIDIDADYDLYNGRIPPGQEKHGVRGIPKYVAGAGFDKTTGTGVFQLAEDNPGVEAGIFIPNFTPSFRGRAPDVGAHQRGEPPMRFGLAAAEGSPQ